MTLRRSLLQLLSALFLLSAFGCAQNSSPNKKTKSTSYDDLTALFAEWRAFERPQFIAGVPDYSATAMARQHAALRTYQQRLASIDPSSWPIPQQVDYRLVQAEMNGLDFDHRVRRPWSRNPAFYKFVFDSQSDTPAREGPVIHGAIDLWTYPLPLVQAHVTELTQRIAAIPSLLQQAERNLTENARDLWVSGIPVLKQQSDELQAFAQSAATSHAELSSAIQTAVEATEAFCVWLEKEAPQKNGPSGVGIENYNWYLKHVHLVPYTWQELVTIMHRELARAHAALRLEEHRNRKLPKLEPIANAEEFDRRMNAAVTEYMAFLNENEIVSMRDYMDQALRERLGKFSPAQNGRRAFFHEVNYRDAVVMRTHGYHWFDLARMQREPHASPIRRVPSLYNIFDSRAEGLATGVEEMMMHAGLFDQRPQARELIWIMLAQRAARALGDLNMHANRATIDEACQFAAQWTPRGWLPADSELTRFEQHLYLEQPTYGTSYVIGKIQIERLLMERSAQLGEQFTLKGFMDELNAAGVIPVSLIRWEMTGNGLE